MHVSNKIASIYIKRKNVRTTGSLLEGNSATPQHISQLITGETNKNLKRQSEHHNLQPWHMGTHSWRIHPLHKYTQNDHIHYVQDHKKQGQTNVFFKKTKYTLCPLTTIKKWVKRKKVNVGKSENV